MPKQQSTSTRAILDELKGQFGSDDARLLQVLQKLSQSRSSDAQSLIRLHENLLFIRAYPPGAQVLKLVEQILKNFGQRVSQLREAEADLSPLDDPEVSGIEGTSVTSNFSYALVRWLVEKYPKQISIDWDWLDSEDQWGATLPRFLPLLDDDAMVEAHVPFRAWLSAATAGGSELVWLIRRFESLDVSDKQKAELYDSLKLHVTWKFAASASRTSMKLPARKIFFHRQPLIRRREVSLVDELNGPKIAVERLSRAAGRRIVDLARETSAVRYRELHGFTYGDSAAVLKADLGRGTEAFLMGVSPEHRLPLRAYHAALIFKNGIPVGYFEGLSLFERMESGFNLYYTFRDGETAWLYARILHLMRQLLGVTVFSIEPYQIGHENEEGIESGAFWFYRKLGFRPVRPELMKLMTAEEQRLARNPRRRTSPRTLRKLAAGHMLFDLANNGQRSDWDRFEVRNIGLAVQRRLAQKSGDSLQTSRERAEDFVGRALGLKKEPGRVTATKSFSDLSLVLAMIPNISEWNDVAKRLVARIAFAKSEKDEAEYLRQMQKHALLRASLIKLGSSQATRWPASPARD